MKLGTETGSLINAALSTSPTVPEVGMGATILCWSDRMPGTIVRVTKGQVHVQYDKYARVDSNGISEDQQYEYSAWENGPVEVFRKTKRGWKSKAGSYLRVGHRERYYDFSF